MPETTWEVTGGYQVGSFGHYGGVLFTYGVVEREDGRTLRTISRELSKEEAHAVANCREAVASLGALSDAIHREDGEDFDSDRVKEELGRAFDVLMRAKGVKP